jgi:Mg2+/Co2+ transporter CorB
MTLTAALIAAAPFILVLLAFSAVFSAAETALTRASRGRMHQLERDGDKAAARVNRLISNQERMIGAVLIGYNVLNILSSVLATTFITAVIPGALGVAIATGLMTILVVVFAEVLPKTVAIVRADDVARALSAPMLVVVGVLGPVSAALQWAVMGALRPLGVRLAAGASEAVAHEEIRGAVEYHHAEGFVESRDRRMLGGVLDLSELTVGEVMVHRRQMAMLDLADPVRMLVEEALASPFTRLPVYDGDPDNVVGVVHAKDLARAIAAAPSVDALDVAAVSTPPWFVPETTHLDEQLTAFLKRRSHFALVVDEYGALQGLVTLEDILEEIVGDIQDEYDTAIEGVRNLPDGSVIVSGSTPLRDLNRALGWDLPEEHAVTLAGLVIHEARAIPEVGQSFIFHGRRFQVLRRQRNQITQLKVTTVAEGASIPPS